MKPFLAFAAFAALTVSAFADDAKSLQAQFQRGMDAHCAAILKGDYDAAARAMDNYFAPDCKIVSDGKTMSYKDWKAGFMTNLKMMKKVEVMKLTCTNVKLTGATASALTKIHVVGQIPDFGGGKTLHKFEYKGTSNSKFAKRKGKWMCVSDVDASSVMTLDGKPFKG